MDEAKDHIIYSHVKWYGPRAGALKLYSDRFAKGSKGPRRGGVIRDNNGFFKVVYGKYFGMKTNNMAESYILELGFKWCVTN